MTTEQALVLTILLATSALFVWGPWRHDMVAVASLLACVLCGIVPADEAFRGFGHPAVTTVACVLVLSRALQASGAVDVLARYVLPRSAGPTASLAALLGLSALLSSFMNNVGAMALLMPVAIQLARRLDLPPARVLMPLAFATVLGGITTLIGTPPNLIVSGFRAQTDAGRFGMFDFTPVGVAVAAAGVAFVALVGWRLVPARRPAGIEGFETGAYLTEARVQEGSECAGKTLRALEEAMGAAGAQVVGLVRSRMRVTAPNPWRRVRVGDVLVIEAEAEALSGLLSTLGLKLEESKRPKDEGDDEHEAAAPRSAKANGAVPKDGKPGEAGEATHDTPPSSPDIVLMELAVLPGSALTGLSARDLQLRRRYRLNLLALSRQGRRSLTRLRSLTIRPGDLLLMQGLPEVIAEFAAESGCVPLAERELRLPNKRKSLLAGGIMAGAVGLAAVGVMAPAISFALGVLALMALRVLPMRSVYDAVDWPVIVLLGALLPVADALASTGAADLVARFLLENVAQGQVIAGLAVVLVVTMFLSDIINNAATAAVMCPIALGTASALQVSPDSFLMAVAIGSSCAFLTPIGHQNNTLILGPGGLRFGDYWRLGLPLEALVCAIAIPLLLLVWPL